MEVIRQIVEKKSITSVFIPEEFGDQVEIIVLPIKKYRKCQMHHAPCLRCRKKSVLPHKCCKMHQRMSGMNSD